MQHRRVSHTAIPFIAKVGRRLLLKELPPFLQHTPSQRPYYLVRLFGFGNHRMQGWKWELEHTGQNIAQNMACP
jgi:hypothetical protein